MKTAFFAVAVLVPALAFADDAKSSAFPGGRAAGTASKGGAAVGAVTAKTPSSARRAARTAARVRGRAGGAASSQDSPPPYAKPGALIRTAGQPPAYSAPGGGGTHSVEGGGFIAIDQKKALDVGRGPGVTWAPPDKKPETSAGSGGGSAVTANGPAPGTGVPPIGAKTDGNNAGGNGNDGNNNGKSGKGSDSTATANPMP